MERFHDDVQKFRKELNRQNVVGSVVKKHQFRTWRPLGKGEMIPALLPGAVQIAGGYRKLWFFNFFCIIICDIHSMKVFEHLIKVFSHLDHHAFAIRTDEVSRTGDRVRRQRQRTKNVQAHRTTRLPDENSFGVELVAFQHKSAWRRSFSTTGTLALLYLWKNSRQQQRRKITTTRRCGSTVRHSFPSTPSPSQHATVPNLRKAWTISALAISASSSVS